MPKQENLLPRKKRGPPPTGKGEPIMVRILPPLMAGLDTYIAKSGEGISRPEAIRRLLTAHLKKAGYLPKG